MSPINISLCVILVIILVYLFYLWREKREKKENLVVFNNTPFEPLPEGIVENGIYGDGKVYYVVQRDPNDRNNYQKRIITGKDSHMLGSPNFRGINKNINLLPDGLPVSISENTIVRRDDGRLGKVVSGEFKQWTHPDSYNKAGQPGPLVGGFDVGNLQYTLPNNIYTYGLMAGPFWMIDSNKF